MVKMNWLLHFFPLISLKFYSRGSPSCHLSTHLSPGLVCISLSSSFTLIPSPTHYNHKPLLDTVARCGVVYTICKSCSLTCVHPEVTQTDTLLEGPKFTLGCRDLLEKKTPQNSKVCYSCNISQGFILNSAKGKVQGWNPAESPNPGSLDPLLWLGKHQVCQQKRATAQGASRGCSAVLRYPRFLVGSVSESFNEHHLLVIELRLQPLQSTN